MSDRWEPLETAPRHRPILACDLHGTYIVTWDGNTWEESNARGEWVDHKDLTHWMDVPPNPHELGLRLRK